MYLVASVLGLKPYPERCCSQKKWDVVDKKGLKLLKDFSGALGS
jgi:hypothetical protein